MCEQNKSFLHFQLKVRVTNRDAVQYEMQARENLYFNQSEFSAFLVIINDRHYVKQRICRLLSTCRIPTLECSISWKTW